MNIRFLAVAVLGTALTASAALSHGDNAPPAGTTAKQAGPAPIRADGHAPIGVMGEHRHKQGEVMFSYRYMHMDMGGNRMGTNNVSPDFIATNVPNRFFGMPGQPPTLRIVPTDMTMDMHMFGAMYAPNDRITLMAMLPYIEKSMDHITYKGPSGTTVLGTFSTHSEGIGDTKVSALIGLMDREHHKLHLNLGLSLPTGSTSERATMLTPTGGSMNMRMGYAMQLGSGTYDLLPGITYSGRRGKAKWGAQLHGTVRMGRNNGYSLGNEAAVTAWASYQPDHWISLSGRVEAKTVGKIDGIDPNIMGPAHPTNPDNYGGNTVTLYGGVNLVAQRGPLRGHRLALELGVPVYQDLNGLQMEQDWSLSVGWQYAF